MRALPQGTVTLLFTDIEGSTRLLHELGAEEYASVLAEHRHLVRGACAEQGGVEVDTQGDAFFVAFPEADGAARAARAISSSLTDGPMRVRIGLHTGTPLLGEEGYIGPDVHLGARIAAAGHGGQVLISAATRAMIDRGHPVTDLGEHRLKDIGQPVAIYQLGTDDFPPLRTISNTNLPRPADTFVGREKELTDVVSRVHARQRLLTLAGPGGSGKTRLAIEAASAMLDDFKAGVFWVDLVPVMDPDAVAGAVAATLTAEQDLAGFIGEREMLLVLDNLEHVIDAAPWIGSLAQACPNLAIIVTSRERMRVRGEALVDVPPLTAADSGELFADRAGMAHSSDIDELCGRLEHLPLAVELAAARASSLTPRQILDRLGERLDILKAGRDTDPRQKTLRATIDWSHSLLEADEQRLLRRLAAFVGGTTLEGVETVCEGDLDTIGSLVDKSLLRFSDGRYTMLETIREYASERLRGSGEDASIRARHAAFIVEHLARWIPELAGGGADELGRSLVAESANLQAAFAWLVESGDAAAATRLIDVSWWYLYEFLSQPKVGLVMCESVLSMPSLTEADRAVVRHREGNFASTLGDIERARQAWRESAELAHGLGDMMRVRETTHNLAIMTADPDEALRLFERSIALARPTDERDANMLKWNLSFIKRRAGDVAAADDLFAEVLAWAHRVNDHHYIAAGERMMGARALQLGDAVQALERANRSRDVGLARNDRSMVVVADALRCRALLRLGSSQEAIGSLGEAADQFRHGDLEADEEIMVEMLAAASELFAAVGATQLAARLESFRLTATHDRPVVPDEEQAHDDWLRSHGVEVPVEAGSGGLRAGLELIRDWLRERGSPTDRA